MTSGSSTPSHLDPDDVDYFRVVVTRARTLVAYTTGGLDTVGSMWDNTGAWLAGNLVGNDDSGPGANFRVARFVQPGTYYIRVSGFGNDENGPYTLHVE